MLSKRQQLWWPDNIRGRMKRKRSEFVVAEGRGIWKENVGGECGRKTCRRWRNNDAKTQLEGQETAANSKLHKNKEKTNAYLDLEIPIV